MKVQRPQKPNTKSINDIDLYDGENQIWLSPPHMSGSEIEYIKEAFDKNYIAPLGENVNAFEKNLENYFHNQRYIAVLNSGTSAIHLALNLLGVGPGDEVLCQSFTFCATANPIVYVGACPIFIDSEAETWNLSPELLEKAIKNRLDKGIKPKAIIVVDLYGMPHKADEITAISKKYNIPVIEDSAEALGSSYRGTKCGLLGDIGILSFNGNKIITTSGGGAIIVRNKNIKDKILNMATQARDFTEETHYEHSSIGFNYRMSNILAGIGRGQMEVLEERIISRRTNYEMYYKELENIAEISFVNENDGFYSNRWLTCIVTPSYSFRENIRLVLKKFNIESRPLWKPMHLQPVYKSSPSFLNGISQDLFERGLCLPSGSNLSKEDIYRITQIIKKAV